MAKPKRKFSFWNIIIIIGIILIIIGVGYEAINYPWRNLGYKLGILELNEELSDPKELDTNYAPFDFNSTDEKVASNTLPASLEELPLTRPPMDLELIGSIKIPRIDISENIVEGADYEILYGVGHVIGTALPGQSGNLVLAGHRNYVHMHPFKHLDKVETGDSFTVTANGQDYTYKVVKVFEALPEDTWVMGPQPEYESMATLITCTPVPSYSHRLIVWGELQ